MYTVHPNQGDVYYLHLFLLHICGLTSFTNLHTVGGHLCETHKEACSHLNVLEDDAESRDCLADATQCCMLLQLRLLFVSILLFCELTDPLSLFKQFAIGMGEDFAHMYSASCWCDVISHNKLLLCTQTSCGMHRTKVWWISTCRHRTAHC